MSSINDDIDFKKVLLLAKKMGVRVVFNGHKTYDVNFVPVSPYKHCKFDICRHIEINTESLEYILLSQNKWRYYVAIDILHELGHLAVCSPSRRNKKDFGIPDKVINKDTEYWDAEEFKACLVESKFCDLINIKPRFPKSFFKGHYAKRKCGSKYKEVMNWWKIEGETMAITTFKKGLFN